MKNLTWQQAGSVILTSAIMTWMFGWQIAMIFVIGIGFHELSHIWAAKKIGFQTQGFFLIPFVGGVALIVGRYRNYAQQAWVAIAGPIGGGLLAAVAAVAYFITGSQFMLEASYYMGLLNLLNLFPFSFLDGGQLLTTVTYSINKTLGVFSYIGLTIIGAILITVFVSPVIGFVVVMFGGTSAIKQFQNWYADYKGQYWLVEESYLNGPKPLSRLTMFYTIAAWLTTVLLLGCLCITLHGRMNP